jgi:hypothetical protein
MASSGLSRNPGEAADLFNSFRGRPACRDACDALKGLGYERANFPGYFEIPISRNEQRWPIDGVAFSGQTEGLPTSRCRLQRGRARAGAEFCSTSNVPYGTFCGFNGARAGAELWYHQGSGEFAQPLHCANLLPGIWP